MTTIATPSIAMTGSAPIAFNERIYENVWQDLRRHHALPASQQQESVAERFGRLLETWRDATLLVSSSTEKLSHPAYLAIVALGLPAVPLILRELKRRPGHWSPALTAITGVVPYSPSLRGNLRAIADAWLEWGRSQGYDV
jgi:hypothetical protein